MTRLFLVRHGETDWNITGRWQGHADVPLNQIGIEQARRVAARFAADGSPIAAIYSSDLSRAFVTAEAIGQALGMQPVPVQELREIDLGRWSGHTRAEIAEFDSATLAQLDANKDVPRGGGESMAALQQRMVAVTERLARNHPDDTIILVSHGGSIRTLLMHAQHGDLATMWNIHIGNTAVSTLFWSPDGWDVGTINDTSHLEGNAVAPNLETAPPDDAQQV